MTTQKLNYEEIAIESDIVGVALMERDESKVELLDILDEIKRLEADRVRASEKLIQSEDTLFKLATMAQECKESIEAAKVEQDGIIESLQADIKHRIEGHTKRALTELENHYSGYGDDDPGFEKIGDIIDTLRCAVGILIPVDNVAPETDGT